MHGRSARQVPTARRDNFAHRLLRSLQGLAIDGEAALGLADVGLGPIRPPKRSRSLGRPMLPPKLGADVGKHLQMPLMVPGEA
jgi:hypothetical protein